MRECRFKLFNKSLPSYISQQCALYLTSAFGAPCPEGVKIVVKCAQHICVRKDEGGVGVLLPDYLYVITLSDYLNTRKRCFRKHVIMKAWVTAHECGNAFHMLGIFLGSVEKLV